LAFFIVISVIYITAAPATKIPLALSEKEMASIVGSWHVNQAKHYTVDGCPEKNYGSCYNMGTWSYKPYKRGIGYSYQYAADRQIDLSDQQTDVCFTQYYNGPVCDGGIVTSVLQREAESYFETSWP